MSDKKQTGTEIKGLILIRLRLYLTFYAGDVSLTDSTYIGDGHTSQNYCDPDVSVIWETFFFKVFKCNQQVSVFKIKM